MNNCHMKVQLCLSPQTSPSPTPLWNLLLLLVLGRFKYNVSIFWTFVNPPPFCAQKLLFKEPPIAFQEGCKVYFPAISGDPPSLPHRSFYKWAFICPRVNEWGTGQRGKEQHPCTIGNRCCIRESSKYLEVKSSHSVTDYNITYQL